MESLDRDPLFVALARPQLLFGVTYSYAVLNFVLTTELFLLSKSAWVIAFAVLIHVAGMVACLRDPNFFELWLAKVRRCPRVRNYRLWQCNSYRA